MTALADTNVAGTPVAAAAPSYKVDVKIPLAKDAVPFDVAAVIPTFHSFIQEQRLPELLVDVADYSHVPDGPGVFLIAHEGLFSIEQSGGLGLRYSQRRTWNEREKAGVGSSVNDADWTGSLRSALTAVMRARQELEASSLLAESLGGPPEFVGSELEIAVNDRLVGPDEAFDAVAGSVRRLFAGLGVVAVCERVEDTGRLDDRLRVTVSFDEELSATELLTRLEP